MIYYFVSHHGHFLGWHVGSSDLNQVPLGDVGDRSRLIAAELADGFRPDYAAFIDDAVGAVTQIELPGLGRQTIRFDPVTRTVSLARDGCYLCAQPYGPAEQNRPEIGEWERFVLCSEAELEIIEQIRAEDWIVKSSRIRIRGSDIRLGPNAALNIGDSKVPLAFNLPLEMPKWPFSFTALVDGWRLEELFLYRPLVSFVAMGGETVLEQLYMSLGSLVLLGQYRGMILLFTDRTAAEICANVPGLAPEQLLIKRVQAHDRTGYKAAKYRILEEPDAYDFQPVVLLDTDIVFNRHSDTFLIAITVAERLSAPIEHFSQLLHSPWMGATLLQLDNCLPGVARGFNAGTIGIPNLRDHGHTLALIRRVIENFITLGHHRAVHWVDQPAANYVSYKTAHFNTNDLTASVRFGTAETPLQPEPATGLLHFCYVMHNEKAKVMEAYLTRFWADAGIADGQQPNAVDVDRAQPDLNAAPAGTVGGTAAA